MKNIITCYLSSLRDIEITINNKDMVQKDLSFLLYINDVCQGELTVASKKVNKENVVYSLPLDNDYSFDDHYSVLINEVGFVKVNTSRAVDFKEFDELFSYDGDDLGTVIEDDRTSFAVWSPLASQVKLKIENKNGSFVCYDMCRSSKGVYRITLNENLDGKKYHYIITNNGVTRETNDPWGKEVSLNSEYSVVTDNNKLYSLDSVHFKNSTDNLLKCIIYETNIRDFSENTHTNIVNKGKYLGFVETNRTTDDGNKAGLDYLKFIDITHVQLNPVTDYFGVDDTNPSKKYNWGYDVTSFFALEGNYSNNPDIPYSRINEFKKVVKTLHENNIGVVLDVVYNHIYKWQDSYFEKVVPGYFFRKRNDGTLYNASGCGNDFASERIMARKAIIDSTKYLIKAFDIDGFRFDLMGLIDLETIKTIVKECKNIKKDLIFYGEGWKMYSGLHTDKLANIENANKIPEVAFFNDTFRDIVKGPTFGDKIKVKGYCSGDPSYHFGLDYVFHACTVKHTYFPKFHYAHQSINFVECHDNQTLFDKISICNNNIDEDALLSKVNLANAVTLLSFGVPFIHSGQEIGQSKNNIDNTYNMTKINQLNWKLIDDRQSMVSYFKSLILFKKNTATYTTLDNSKDIDNTLSFYQFDNSILTIKTKKPDSHNRLFLYLVNPTENVINFELDDYYFLYGQDEKHKEAIKSIKVSPSSLIILYKI